MDTQPTPTQTPAPAPATPQSQKLYVTAWILAFLLGGLGIDRFYRGQIGLGVLKLITLGGFGVWSFIDFLMIGFGHPKDKSGVELSGRDDNRTLTIILTVVGGIIYLMVVLPITIIFVLSFIHGLQVSAAQTAAQQH